MVESKDIDIVLGFVSVPYRGATFLNIDRFLLLRRRLKVSVPYRGATFLNIKMAMIKCAIFRFRPLSGSYISQWSISSSIGISSIVSVPYRGATFLNLVVLIC